MGAVLSWAAVSAFMAVAWPIRGPKKTSPVQVPCGPGTSAGPELINDASSSLEAELWASSSPSTNPAPDQVARTTQADVDPWVRIVKIEAGTDPGLYRTICNNSPMAYFEWRMSLGLTEPDEERVIYQDYTDQCALGGYNPIPMVTWCRGMVKCGCVKRVRVRKYDSVNRERRPNMLEWPTRIGMT